MASKDPVRVQDNKVVMAKLSREEFSQFQHYCDSNGETINAALKRIILSEVKQPTPPKIAGKNAFVYNKNRDNFSWKVVLDNGSTICIDSGLPVDYATQLFASLNQALDERNGYLKKKREGSVAIPLKLVRGET